MSKLSFMTIFSLLFFLVSSIEADDHFLSSAFNDVEINNRGQIEANSEDWNLVEGYSSSERIVTRRLKKNGDFKTYQTVQTLGEDGEPKALFELEGSYSSGYMQSAKLIPGHDTRSLRYFDYETKNMATCTRENGNHFLFIANKHKCSYFTKDVCDQLSEHDLFGKSNELKNCANNLESIQEALTTPSEKDRDQLNEEIAKVGDKYTRTIDQEVEKEKEYELDGAMNMLKTFHEALNYCESVHDFYNSEYNTGEKGGESPPYNPDNRRVNER